MINDETWAIVAATALGPIAAVGLTLWRESVARLHKRRLDVFRSLMSTRRTAISNEHVNALNLVEVDFYNCPDVQAAWKAYKAHLYMEIEEETQVWRDKKEDLLARMLFEIGKILGYEIPALDIFKGGYAPKGWEFRDNIATGAVAFLNDLGHGKRVLPILITDPPQPQQPPASKQSQ